MTQETQKQEAPLALRRLMSLADIMQAFEAARWVTRATELQRVGEILTSGDAARPLSEEQRNVGRDLFREILRECIPLGLLSSLASATRILTRLEQASFTHGQLAEELGDLRRRIVDEFAMREFVVIDAAHSDLWLSSQPLGADVASHFPSARDDLEEAAKCVALGRSTAVVFHLMRVLERALHALGRSLGRPELTNSIAGKNWEEILGPCRSELNKQNRDRVAAWAADPVFYSDAVQRLIAIKEAWRNEVMHVRPDGYNEQQAREIWTLTDGFMRLLATKLRE